MKKIINKLSGNLTALSLLAAFTAVILLYAGAGRADINRISSQTTVSYCTEDFIESYVEIFPYSKDDDQRGFFLIINDGLDGVPTKDGIPLITGYIEGNSIRSTTNTRCLFDCAEVGDEFGDIDFIYECDVPEDCIDEEDEVGVVFNAEVDGEISCRTNTKANFGEAEDFYTVYATEPWVEDTDRDTDTECGTNSCKKSDSKTEPSPPEGDDRGHHNDGYFDTSALDGALDGRQRSDCSLAPLAPIDIAGMIPLLLGLALIEIARRRKS